MYSGWMRFGKYKGRRLDEIPSGYLQWLLRLDDLAGGLRYYVQAELNRRQDEEPESEAQQPALAVWEPIVRTWHREMTVAYHPDRGGSNEAMAAVNDGADRLRRLFQECES